MRRGWVVSIIVQRRAPTIMSSRKVDDGLVGIQLDGPAFRERLEQGPDAGLGDRMPAVFHGARGGRLELERAGEQLVESDVVRQHLAAVPAGDVDRLAAAAGCWNLK